ncbi:hypothetical protein HNW77_10235 [Komagataeibacter sp. AV436]|uniref:Uncharacterized protein n=1 Tax=Komagataeibacter melomenusus TaxID=2766578 RepID=A0ABX2AEZ1_9PROT|nr:hypothetical protein [Komagataeibacter melomenusus]MBV1830056.1 hypothetical protein [Komagataeibacter melomenusus]NPC66766.1 hypothetical protein [Komagataeibacter melomenusus]
MELFPFEKIMQVPRYPANSPRQDFVDIPRNIDLIHIADSFAINSMRGLIKSKTIGIVAYIFGAHLKIEFKKDYTIATVEFRIPYEPFDEFGLFYDDTNLFNAKMKNVYDELNHKGIKTEMTDVGFCAPSIGVNFFSCDFDKSLDVSLDTVTVFL